MRKNLVEFMESKDVTKSQMARDLDFTSSFISQLVYGKTNGSYKFWRKLKEVYDVTDEEINELKKVEN